MFLQRDPEGYADSVNLYAGMAWDPINNRDPTGRVLPAVGACIASPVCRAAVGGAVGGLIGAGFDAARQLAEISDGTSEHFDWSRVGKAAVYGAGVGATAALNPQIGSGIAAGSAAYGTVSGFEEFRQEHYWTAAIDLAGAALAGFGSRKLQSLPASAKAPPPAVEAAIRAATERPGPPGAPLTEASTLNPHYSVSEVAEASRTRIEVRAFVEQDGQSRPVGRIETIFDPERGDLHVDLVDVDTAFQKRGIGTGLYSRALQTAGDDVQSVSGIMELSNRIAIENGGKRSAPRVKILQKLGFWLHVYNEYSGEMVSTRKKVPPP